MPRMAVLTVFTRILLSFLLGMSWTFAVAGEPVRIGILTGGAGPGPTGAGLGPTIEAVVSALRELGYRDSENIVLDYRYAAGKPERFPELAKELVALPVHVIVAVSPEAVSASKSATSAIPIVNATAGGDFVAMGWIVSWDRPGGNVTGMHLPAIEAGRKRVELLKHALPSLSRLAVLVYTPNPASPQFLHEVEAAAKEHAIHLLSMQISKAEELEAAFGEARQAGAQAVLTLQDQFYSRQRKKLAELATQYKLQLAGGEPRSAEAGAFLQVGPDIYGCARGAAVFVDRLLKGATASDLPIERCRKMEVVFNLKAAREVGLTLDPTLTRGARVIE